MHELKIATGLDPELGPRARKDTDYEPYWEDALFLRITAP